LHFGRNLLQSLEILLEEALLLGPDLARQFMVGESAP
jgi:hypothetical protein